MPTRMEPEESDRFWSTILKKYSGAFEEVVKLKQKIQAIQQQYDSLRNRTHSLEQENEQLMMLAKGSRSTISDPPASCSTDEQGKEAPARLQGAEIGLEKARHEYAKLREKLHASEAKIASLNAENATLLQQKLELSRQRDSLLANTTKLQAALNVGHENDDRNEQLNELIELRLENAALKSQFAHRQNENTLGSCEDGLKAEIQCRENEELRRSSQADKSSNDELRTELALARESLQKSKDAHKALVATMVQLQNMVHKAPILSRANMNRSSISTAPTSTPAGSRRVSFAITAAQAGIPSPVQAADDPSNVKQVTDLSQNDDLTIVEEKLSQIGPVYVISLPTARRQALATFPPVNPDTVNGDGAPKLFTRQFLASELGCSMKQLIVKASQSLSEVSRTHGISCYICVNLDHNPWCPSSPGQHGYIFVDPEGEKNMFAEPEVHNMFVGTKKTSRSRRLMTYMGVYRFERVDPLSAQEWNTLSSDVKRIYYETTKEKTKDIRRQAVDLIRSEYDSGQLRVPCVRVLCVDFDKELYNHLVAANKKSMNVADSRSSGKRRRGDCDKDFEGNTRRCGRKSH